MKELDQKTWCCIAVGHGRRFRRVLLIILGMTAANLLWGCGGRTLNPSLFGSPHETGDPSGHVTRPIERQSGQKTFPITLVRLEFEVLRVEFSRNRTGDSRIVWNHVDMLRLDPDIAARLARNGLRVGVAKPESWPAIATILDDSGIERRKERFLTQQGQPLSLTMGKVGESESVFVYGRDNRAAGKTFRAGDKLITIDYLLRGGPDGKLDLRVGFEIRNDLGIMTWERRDGIVREVPASDRHVFDELATSVALERGEALIIGFSGESENEYLIGNRFMRSQRDGRTVETLLIITPRSFRAELSDSVTGK